MNCVPLHLFSIVLNCSCKPQSHYAHKPYYVLWSTVSVKTLFCALCQVRAGVINTSIRVKYNYMCVRISNTDIKFINNDE